ncbi:hypothetical protein WFZ85_12415 [Flavobacterium sp. j3]|uniref:Uncharacterized protein n=1 Tax=Flavobacterium aureirubrum TaxID=3133147 RepID=A0ABU9NBR6_9FLAO
MNGKTNKIIYAIEDLEYPNYPKSILLYNRINFISNEEAVALINKYNPNATLQSLKTENDTIYLEVYSKFRTSEFYFLSEMRKVPDTISLSIGFSGGKQKVFKERINW